MLAFLQKIGKSLMLPVAALPAAALLLRFGNIDYVKDFGFGQFGDFLNHYIAPFLAAGGSAIFDNLPLIFAIGVAIGMAGDAVATLAAVIAYLVLTNVLGKIPTVFTGLVDKDTTLNMGVLGGIIAGLVASYFYNKYHDIKLPDWLGFFGGKRFVPIITSFAMVIVGLIFGLIWGPVQSWLDTFGRWIVDLGGVGAFIFMTANRLLIPFGLHHVINAIAWFQIGDYTDAAGNVVHGDLHRFFAGDPTAGMFMTGFFPIMMFALPAAAFAIIHTAKPEKRKLVSSIFIGSALASFLTGITEPLEFAFMFVAPVLYVIHAVLTGISAWLVVELGIHHGFGFSAGFLDYAINYPLSTKGWMIIPIGLVYAVVYYVLFRVVIVKLNLKTPGREDDDLVEDGAKDGAPAGAGDDKASQVLAALGGSGNIESIDACITRLRLIVKDEKAVNDAELKRLGAAGVMRLGKGAVQAIFGTQSERLKEQIKKRM
ncbi:MULTISPECIES: N-acetylglucosamine-specific PTS transporter subunit IIBC [Paenibacillus]|uniref:PTS acetylglucosamine transporter subunit IIB n=1 Tax=Paenibacillus glycanilyticus TaxID=126569 RepID=A0ABQ6NGQ8_9BACL|nr:MULTISPECIES: N-acetylglucosamine-specific PTS transporter subunit IIBC [Paenibacillus]MCK9860192.1 N-acetylglucosamine-specific PTS transporter subunit IIBC [Paenibacillus sp. ATY16]GMK44270.1 PTS acetylglucosamine transporter subunit IIB [Paenibacillus glycanilyticus]